MKISQGEKRIIDILRKEGLEFRREYSFPDLLSRKKRKLRFDFAIFKNNKLMYLIEYDGQQHFKEVKHFSKKTNSFNYLQESDLQKNKYCLMNNIKLYRIPFYDFNKINSVDDLIKDDYLVKNKWHNYNIRHLISQN